MGEIAEMMLDGTLCEGCGVYLHGESNGVPRRCRSCRGERSERRKFNPDFGCPKCSERFKTNNDRRKHLRDAHGLKMHPGGILKPIGPGSPAHRLVVESPEAQP